MKNINSKGLFDEAIRLEKLTNQGDPLVILKQTINWEQFRPKLDSVLKKEAKGPGGREPFDYIMMFKILILQRYYNLSDDRTEFQILDRMTFMRFLDLELSDKVPDSKTIWLFKEILTKANAVEKLFEKFHDELEKHGYIGNEGKIIDASFVEVPRQRNSREENKEIKGGNVPEDWQENPHKLSQKDIDAKWTKKNNVTFYGYKDHVKTDKKSKFIDKYKVTDASVHDSQPLYEILEAKDADQPLNADSAYTGEDQEKTIEDKKMINCVNEKGYRNKPLTEKQIAKNKEKSRIRARVEHVFGFIENSMNGSFIRTIGIARTTATIGLMNLTYNMFRLLQLQKIGCTR